jgi:hypothetical protein
MLYSKSLSNTSHTLVFSLAAGSFSIDGIIVR